MIADISYRFALRFDKESARRIIGGKEVIIHCHHYNSRLQRAIEASTQIDGKAIVVGSAEAVFADLLRDVILPSDEPATRWHVASKLYAHLGYGNLDFSEVDRGLVTSNSSHFVEGWRAAMGTRSKPVCSLAQGYCASGGRAHFEPNPECDRNRVHVLRGRALQI